MPNPTINFRLSPYQIARGLQIIRQLEPNYNFTSSSKLIKTLYLDYLAKMSLNKDDAIPQHFLDEVDSITYQIKKPIATLNDFTKKLLPISKEEKSVKTNVEDFSPPENWGE